MNRKLKISVLFILCVALMGTMLFFGANSIKAEATEREITASGTSGDVEWTLYSDGALYIYGNGAMEDYSTLPKVPWASYRSTIVSVEISDGVTAISDYAFSFCSNLKSVKLPDSLKQIGFNAFSKCTNLEAVTIPNSVTSMENSVFSGCTSLTSVSIPNGITQIGSTFFSSCSALKSVSLPDSVTKIDRSAFLNCTALESITLPEKLKTIGENAFYGCTKILSIDIPDSTTTIGTSAFYECTNLTDLTIGNGVTNIGNYAFFKCSSITDIIIPGSVETLGNQAFYYCTALKNATIRNGVTAICNSAFSGCTSLTKIVIPESVTQIGSSAFSGCSLLSDITVSGNPEYVGQRAFYNTAFYKDYANWDNGFLYLKDILIEADNSTVSPQCVIYSKTRLIAANAFASCTNVESITMADKVEYINDYAFSQCSNLESIRLSANLKSIGAYSFKECDALTSIEIPCGVSSVKTQTFYGCDKLETITLNKGLLEIGNSAFSYLPCLNEIYIPETVTAIDSTAFSSSGITDIYYGNSKAEWKRTVSGESLGDITIHYTLKSDDESVIINHTDSNFDYEAGNIHLVVENLGNATSSYEQNGFYSRLLVDPIQVLDIKLVDGDGNNIQPLSDETITVKIKASEEFMSLMKSGLSAVGEYDVNAENIDFSNDCFVFENNGEVVTVPASETFLKKFKIIHWYSDAVDPTDHESFTHDEIIVENGYIIIEANHFSEYAVCTELVTAEDYIIKWIVNGVATEQTVTEQTVITQPEAPEKEGYTFVGWTPSVPDTMPAQNLEFTAVWQVNQYTITFDTAGGSEISPITLDYGSAITPPENPTLEGYVFKNWTPAIPEAMPANDLTVVAVYEKDEISEVPENPKVTVIGIKIISLPNKTQYTYKVDSLDLSGLVIKIMYSDGTSKIISDTKTVSAYGFNVDSVGTKTITVSYGGYTDDFEITVSYAWWQWIIRILLLGFIWY